MKLVLFETAPVLMKSCDSRTTAGAVRVLAGLHDLSKKEFYTQERAVAEITIHPNYSFKKLSHDMAIIKASHYEEN